MSPIIVAAKHFDSSSDSSERVLLPALWGIIPRWHSGDYKKHGLTTNNARLESIETSKLYKPCLDRGRRCVVPIEGFYEWNTTNPKLKSSQRPAYYVYMPQQKEVKIEDKSTWSSENVNLMFVAGLFDVWTDSEGDSIYNFTVISFESDEHFKWLHHRTPAILETEQQINNWLNFDEVPTTAALKAIKHPKSIIWHKVSNQVNSSRNKSEKCNKPLVESAKQNTLMAWMKRKSDEKESDSNDPKKHKK